MERYSSALASNSLDLSSVCDLVGVCPACFADQIHNSFLPWVTSDVLFVSSKVDFLPAGLLLFHVSELYVLGYVHLVEWEFCRSPPIRPGFAVCVILVQLTLSVAFALVELLPASLGYA